MRSAFNERRQLILRELNAISGFSCIEPKGAFYAMPNIKATGFNAQKLQDELLERVGVATIAGTSFGEFGEGYLRFSYAASNEEILEAMNRIKTFLADRS